MRFFWQDKPRPLTYENRCGFHKSEWNGDARCYLCSDEMDALRIAYQPNKQEDALDKLLQSHAALEQKIQSIEERLPTKLFAEVASVADALSRLDARLKGSTDALSVLIERTGEKLFEESIPELYTELGTVNDTIADLSKALKLARRKRK